MHNGQVVKHSEELTEEKKKQLVGKYDSESRFRNLNIPWMVRMVTLLAVGLALFHLVTSFTGPLVTLKHRALHTGVILALVFLLYPSRKRAPQRRATVVDLLLALLSVATIVYIFADYSGIVSRAGLPNQNDLLFSILIVILVLEGGRRVVGNGLTLLASLFLLYAYFGPYLPRVIAHRGYAIDDIATYMYLTTEGIYGTAIGVSATYIFLFVLFGAFLNRTGMGQLFNDAAMAISGHTSGGPAKVAVISSGFLGSINGSAIANVVTTGSFTIPLMKRTGYSKNFSGAVEAAASVGGQVLPPVMGATAFIMAETLGKPYAEIALAAVLPGVLYYMGVITVVHLRAKKRGLRGLSRKDLPNMKQVIKERGHLLIPLVILIYMLFGGFTPIYAAAWAIISTVVIAMFRKTTRLGPKKIVQALEEGTRSALGVAMACAMVGIIVGVASLTGFGLKMTTAILVLGQNTLILTLFFTMLASIILGMGLPSIPTYIITSSMAAPALVKFGVDPFVSHMFVFYFGILANLTPPVALAAFAGAGISGGDPNRTGFNSLKLAAAGILVPYVFVYSPELLMQGTSALEIIWVTITAALGIIALGAGLEGYLLTDVHLPLRILAVIGAVTLVIPGLWTDMIGLSLVIIVLAIQMVKRKRSSNIE
ncbi:TRAP transporter fused permease subunit [Virgibacillus dakarensis]|uniref:C4-dicarboxylate ABC transporter n=1 Tax=Lentibacillus populi TaxID=1827502 RepID=A0A9W5X6L8_9BACI|nr:MULTISPECIES: TRAP transporter permease [Bacillaceae]MTW85222.1 TRAP transporter fused permease subunit [Virgibacillus dakarensis]GGB48603.1 C4-dicarboxylate ABC transporter [Lentibacillus populi]